MKIQRRWHHELNILPSSITISGTVSNERKSESNILIQRNSWRISLQSFCPIINLFVSEMAYADGKIIVCKHTMSWGSVRFRRRFYVRYIRTAYVLTVATVYACGKYYIGMTEPEWLAKYLTDLIFQTSKQFKSLLLCERWSAPFELLFIIMSFLLTINKIAFIQSNSL